MKKLLSCVLAVSMIFGMSVGAFAKRDDDDDFRASDSRLYLDNFDDDEETLSPGDTETFGLEDKREYSVTEGTDKNVDGRYDVTYSHFNFTATEYGSDESKKKIEDYIDFSQNGDEVTVKSKYSGDDEDFEKEFGRGMYVKFTATCEKEWTKLSDNSEGIVKMSGEFEVWISTGDVSGNNQFGIEIDNLDDDRIYAPGTIYEFDLENEKGTSLDPDDEEMYNFSVKPTKGSGYFDIFKLVTDKEGHYVLQFRGDVEKFDNNVKDIEVTTKIRKHGERDYIEKVYEFQLGFEEEWEDNSKFDIDNDQPYIKLDSDLDDVEASVEHYCKIKWRRLDNRGYNFTYDERPDDTVVENNSGATLKFLNFRGRPEFAACATIKLNISKTPYVYEYDSNGNLTEIETELKDAYTTHFQTAVLGSYVFSNKKLISTPTTPEPVVEKPVVPVAPAEPVAPVKKPVAPVAPVAPQPATQPEVDDNLVKKGMFNDEAETNFVKGKYNPPTGVYFI